MDTFKLRRNEADLKDALKKAKEAMKVLDNVLSSDLLDGLQALIDEVSDYALCDIDEMIGHIEEGDGDA